MTFCTLRAAPLVAFRGVEFAPDRSYVHVRRRQLQAHLVHGVGNDLRYGEVAELLVVRRNNVPGRALRAG